MRLVFGLLVVLFALTTLGLGAPTQPSSFKLPVTHDPITRILTADGALHPGITALLGGRLMVYKRGGADDDVDVDLQGRDFNNPGWNEHRQALHPRSFPTQPWKRDENDKHDASRSFITRTFTSRPWRKWRRDDEGFDARSFMSRPWKKWRKRSNAPGPAQHPFATSPAPSSAIHDEGWGIIVTPTENNDGDNEWLVELDVGTPSQKLSVVFDTGSSATWVYSPVCCYPDSHRYFDPRRSSTFSNRTVSTDGKPVRAAAGAPGQLWSQQYARGRRIEGSLGIDTVGFSSGDDSNGGATLSLTNSTIALATSVVGQSRESRKMEGLVGLAPGSANDVAGGWFNPLELAAERGLLKYPYLTATLFAANRTTGKDGGGHYVIGDVDNDHSRDDAVFQATSSTAFWGAQYDEGGLSIGAKPLTSGNPDRRYIIDTGTAIISLPGDMATSAHASIAGSLFPTSGAFVGYWLVPCAVGRVDYEASLPVSQRTPNLSITILHHTFRIPAQDLVFQPYYPVPAEDAGGRSDMCISGIQKAASNDFIVLGLAFVKNHVVTFDFGNRPRRQRRIGIASRTDLPILSG